MFAELSRLRAQGVPFCLATVVRVEAPTSAKPGDKAVITADGTMTGWIGGSCSQDSIKREALASLEEGMPRLVRIEPAAGPVDEVPRASAPRSRAGEVVLGTSCPSGGTLEIFLEPQLARPQLVVIGHSPAARTLIRLAGHVGFRTCGAHPGAGDADFPGADLLLPHLELASAGAGPDSWIVVATMGQYDEEALEAALRTNAAYVGLIASRRRRNAVVDILRKRGWSSDALAGIVNPAGRMLGDTQEEIALSVLADIVDRRHRRETRRVTAGDSVAALFATDPICGMSVEIAGARYVRDGIYFCGQGCLEAYSAQEAVTSEDDRDPALLTVKRAFHSP